MANENENEMKEYGIDECPPAFELPENKLRHNFRLGDITWVKHSDSSWWPAQVIDEAYVGSKPKKKAKYDCLVRLYGTCQYLYVDPWKSNSEFATMLKRENKSIMEAFREVLEKELSCVNSSSDYDEKAVNSKGGSTKVSGVTFRKGKSGLGRQSSSPCDKEQSIDTASCEKSSEGLRNKRQKQVAHVLDKKGCQIGASVVRREGLRQSARTNANEYLDGAEDRRALLTEGHATEDSMADGTSASHGQIKSMVRDILFKDIIDREHDTEMAYIDEVINGICNATEDNATGGATASTKVSKLDQATEDTMQVTNRGTLNQTTKITNSDPVEGVIGITPSRDRAMTEPGQLSSRQIRQIRIMQNLGLIAPSGSPFGNNIVVTATRQ